MKDNNMEFIDTLYTLDEVESSLWKLNEKMGYYPKAKETIDRVKGFPFETNYMDLLEQVSDWIYRVSAELKREYLKVSILECLHEAEEELNKSTDSSNVLVGYEDLTQAMQDAYDELTR